MEEISPEVLLTLNLITERLCGEKSDHSKTETKGNFVKNTNKDSNKFYLNGISNETLKTDHTVNNTYDEIFDHNVETSANSSGFEDFEESAKCTPENKVFPKESQSFDSETDLFTDDKREFCMRTSTPSNEPEDVYFFKSNEESLDKIIDEAINMYGISFTKRREKLKNTSVQTNQIPKTMDNECQCDLVQIVEPRFCLEDSTEKRKKLDNNGKFSLSFKETYKQFEGSECLQAKDKSTDVEVKHSGRYNTSLNSKTTSRIRVGLSKRIKPRPLHTNYYFD